MLHGLRMGYPLIGLTIFATELGLPVPSELILMAAGSLIASGSLDLVPVLILSVSCCLLADIIWFEAGRHWGSGIIRILTIFSEDPKSSGRRAQDIFAKWGMIAVAMVKFVPGIDILIPPLAGIQGLPRRSFIALDTAGSLVWCCAYVSCGYFFAERVTMVATWMGRFGNIVVIAIGGPLTLLVAHRAWSTFRMLKSLKSRRISATLLHHKIELAHKLAIIDLLNFEEVGELAAGIPGAVRLSPGQLKKHSRLIAPADVQIILYGSSSSAIRSARVALSLQRKGLASMWILEGGLQAWTKAGFPVSDKLSTEAEGAARSGIQILDE